MSDDKPDGSPATKSTSFAPPQRHGPARLARPGPTVDTYPNGSLKKPLPKHVEERCRVTIDGFMNRPLPRWLRNTED